jgi:molybdopterin/thiamine biosynthesis adenylyltransferase
VSTRILVCGVGALGSHAALLLRNEDATLVLVDDDRVETKNLAAQGFVKPSLGKNKAQALKQQLKTFYGVVAEAKPVRFGEHNAGVLLEGVGLALDCFDNAASRRLLQEAAREAEVPLLHGALSADGTFGLVRWSERFVPDEEDAPGQATCEGGEHLPLIALAAATLARSAQDFLHGGSQHDAMITLRGVTPTS